MSTEPLAVVVMGVSGCGKSTIAAALAAAVGGAFTDADDLHPEANVKKMASGTPLTDEDRWPWLAEVGAAIRAGLAAGTPAVVACSALRRAYREAIAAAAGTEVRFVHLHGSRELIAARMHARAGHFMPPGLLDSQFATLEPLEPGEPGLTVGIEDSPQAVVATIHTHLKRSNDLEPFVP
ncbi:gluconokinase [Glycomyces sp. NPDC048151]|uniref:gluconokinase n=1 Tax=Glycomyces sp. NPDC048151 TaxID=3364002 RepID=UPI00371E7BB2